MKTAVIEGIRKELARLDKPEWEYIARALTENYRGYPFDDPDTQSPGPAIYAILQTIEPSEISENTDEEFIRRLSRSDIFSFRAYCSTHDGPVYWEPLKQRLSDFNSGAETTKYQSEHEYPSPDVIRGWYYHKLNTLRQ